MKLHVDFVGGVQCAIEKRTISGSMQLQFFQHMTTRLGFDRCRVKRGVPPIFQLLDLSVRKL
jgi:hypothetical protein